MRASESDLFGTWDLHFLKLFDWRVASSVAKLKDRAPGRSAAYAMISSNTVKSAAFFGALALAGGAEAQSSDSFGRLNFPY
jgi:hypothetical protein